MNNVINHFGSSGRKKDAESVRIAYAEAFKRMLEALKRSLTCDQGKEKSQHKKVTIDSGIQVYFAHTSSPWSVGQTKALTN
jgi:IS30 family transposase